MRSSLTVPPLTSSPKHFGKRPKFDAPPNEEEIRINVFGELTKGSNFDAQYLYVDFEWELHDSYHITEDSASQVTQFSSHCVSSMNSTSNASSLTQMVGSWLGIPLPNQIYNFAFPFEFEMETTDS